jgi:S-adenosylmethionine decarboxylase
MAASPFLWVQTFGETRPMGEDFLEALKLIDPPVSLSREIGTHVIGDLSGIASHLLSDEVFLMKILKEGLESERFTILGQQSLKFPGEESGVTGFYILSESHAAFHSYPEYGYIALDVFSCGDSRPDRVVAHVARALGADNSGTKTVDRRARIPQDF